eukprot:snap_masked-scaffold_48-processed-gene-1.51-mRNA-1 protein AED:1.00 eAED:1.00 QI:0/-1/0/0/-1/1/1/0/90
MKDGEENVVKIENAKQEGKVMSDEDMLKYICYGVLALIVLGIVIAAIAGVFGECDEEYEDCSSRSSGGRRSSGGGRRGLVGFTIDSVLDN